MYFLVNASPPNWLDVADALVISKAGICDGVPSTEVEFVIISFLNNTCRYVAWVQSSTFWQYFLMLIFKKIQHQGYRLSVIDFD